MAALIEGVAMRKAYWFKGAGPLIQVIGAVMLPKKKP
jgi:hypothetical protein